VQDVGLSTDIATGICQYKQPTIQGWICQGAGKWV